MTDKTTRIYVDLTDGQMKYPASADAQTAFYAAVVAQRPRPIAVGDQVTFRNDLMPARVYSVEAFSHGMAWVYCLDADLWDTTAVSNLTRVDGEAQP